MLGVMRRTHSVMEGRLLLQGKWPLVSDLLLGKLECIGHENWVFAVEWNRDVRSLGNPLGKWWSGKL